MPKTKDPELTEAMLPVTQALEPCPFCGGEAEFHPTFWGLQPQVSCQCGAKVWAYSETESITAWNTRIASQSERESVLEEAAKVAGTRYARHGSELGTVRARHYEHAGKQIAGAIRALKTTPTPPPSTDKDARIAELEAENARLRADARNEVINTPETADFMAAVPLEAAHQRERWGADHDAGKAPLDWFWLIGYLSQKAATAQIAGDADKALHHTISTAAALANWHAAIAGTCNRMVPGAPLPIQAQALKGQSK